MRLLFLAVFLVVNLLGSKTCNAQTGTFIWTNGAPTTNPGASGARFAVDRATFRWYEWVSGTTWIGSGDRIQQISGCSAPNYTPAIHNSLIVINSCTDPEIYIWNGSTWKMPPGGGGGGGTTYTAGTGINISVGNVISNTSPDQTVTITGATGVYPSFTLPDASATNELQTISTTGAAGNITLSNSGGTLNLNVNDADANPTNEIQALSTSGAAGNITLSNGGGTLNLNVNDADASATNEIQSLSLVGSNLSLSNGGGTVTLPTGGAASDSLYRIANVAAFANTSIASKWETGRVVSTDGFYSAGDGGAANYIIEASGTVDNISVFAVGSRRARVVANADGGINVLQLGAKLNDGLDDKAAFQKAIDLFSYIYYRGVGEFNLGSRLKLTDNKHLEFHKYLVLKQITKADVMLYTDYTTLNENITIEGGTWNRNFNGSRPYNTPIGSDIFGQVLLDYCFLLANTKNLTVKDLTILHSPKFAISNGHFENSLIENIIFDTEADGVHMMGPGNQVTIRNISGRTGDDFIAVGGSDYTANAYSEGSIKGIYIKDISTDSTYGNIVALFPGNDGLGNDFRFDDVYISEVHGHTIENPVINLIQYGSLSNPAQMKTARGIYGDVHISNISASSGVQRTVLVASDTMNSLTLSNIYVDVNDAITFTSGIVPGALIRNVTATNCIFKGIKSNVNCFNFTGDVSIDNLIIDGMNQRNSSTSSLAINMSTTGKINNFSLLNSKIFGTVDGVSRVYIQTDSVRMKFKNVYFYNSYRSIILLGRGYDVWVDDVDFGNASLGVSLLSATTTANIYPSSYKFLGDDYNAFRAEASGSVCNILTSNVAFDRHLRRSTDFALPNEYSIGHRLSVTNTHASSTIFITAPSPSLVNGATAVPVLPGQKIELIKHSASAWEGTVGSPTGTFGQTLYNDGTLFVPTSNLYNNGTNVGVGVTVVPERLTVNGYVSASSGYKTASGTAIRDNGTHYTLFPGSSGSLERFDIGESSTFTTWWRSTGNIGIGTGSPSQRLEIRDGFIYSNGEGTGIVVDAGGNKRMGFVKRSGFAPQMIYSADNFDISYTSTGSVLSGTPTMAMRFKTNGNVGINSVDPSEKLEVNGNIKSTNWASAGNRLLFANFGGVSDETTIDPADVITTANRQLPTVWTTGTRPIPSGGQYPFGFNTTTGKHEGWDGSAWNEFYEIGNIIKASATLDFPSTGPNTNSDLTATVTGAAVGDVVTVTPPLAAISAHSCYTAWVSAANTVTVRFNHYGTGGATNPASGVFNIIVTKF